MKSESIVLTGMAGVGKTNVGAILAKLLGFAFLDLDKYILEKDGKTIQEIIDQDGEEALLKLEKKRMYEIELRHIVVAPGGSIIYHADLMEYLKKESTLVYLKDTFENIDEKITNLATRGIVGFKEKTLKQIYDERGPLYDKYADMVIDCHEKSYEKLAEEIKELFLHT